MQSSVTTAQTEDNKASPSNQLQPITREKLGAAGSFATQILTLSDFLFLPAEGKAFESDFITRSDNTLNAVDSKVTSQSLRDSKDPIAIAYSQSITEVTTKIIERSLPIGMYTVQPSSHPGRLDIRDDKTTLTITEKNFLIRRLKYVKTSNDTNAVSQLLVDDSFSSDIKAEAELEFELVSVSRNELENIVGKFKQMLVLLEQDQSIENEKRELVRNYQSKFEQFLIDHQAETSFKMFRLNQITTQDKLLHQLISRDPEAFPLVSWLDQQNQNTNDRKEESQIPSSKKFPLNATTLMASENPHFLSLISHSKVEEILFPNYSEKVDYSLIKKYLKTNCYLNGEKVRNEDLNELKTKNPSTFISFFNEEFPNQRTNDSNQVLIHFSEKLIELISNAFNATSSGIRAGMPSENFIHIDIYEENGVVYQKVILEEIPLKDKNGVVLGYVNKPLELIAKLTESGFQLLPESGTDSAVLNQILMGEEVLEEHLTERYKNEISKEKYFRGILSPARGKEKKHDLSVFTLEKIIVEQLGALARVFNASRPEERVLDLSKAPKNWSKDWRLLPTREDYVDNPKKLAEFQYESNKHGFVLEVDPNVTMTDHFFKEEIVEINDEISVNSVKHQSWVKTFIHDSPFDDNGKFQPWVRDFFPIYSHDSIENYLNRLFSLSFEFISTLDGKIQPDILKYIGGSNVITQFYSRANIDEFALRDALLNSAMENFMGLFTISNSEYLEHSNLISFMITLQQRIITTTRKSLQQLKSINKPEFVNLANLCEEALTSMLKTAANFNHIPWLAKLVTQAVQSHDQVEVITSKIKCRIALNKLKIQTDNSDVNQIYQEYLNTFNALCELDDVKELDTLTLDIENTSRKVDGNRLIQSSFQVEHLAVTTNCCNCAIRSLDKVCASPQSTYLGLAGKQVHAEAKKELAKLDKSKEAKEIASLTEGVFAAATLVKKPTSSNIVRAANVIEKTPGRLSGWKIGLGLLCLAGAIASFVAMPITGGTSGFLGVKLTTTALGILGGSLTTSSIGLAISGRIKKVASAIRDAVMTATASNNPSAMFAKKSKSKSNNMPALTNSQKSPAEPTENEARPLLSPSGKMIES